MQTDQRPQQEHYQKGYLAGLTAIAFMILRDLPHGAPLPDNLGITIPANESSLATIARQSANEHRCYAGRQPDLEQYVRGYVAGYLFSLYALPHGLLQLLFGFSLDERILLILRFTLDDSECEATLQPALHSLRSLHQAYRGTLN